MKIEDVPIMCLMYLWCMYSIIDSYEMENIRVWFEKSNKSWKKMWIGPGSPFGLDDKAPEPPRCLILEDLQTLHVPTNKKKLEVRTQYRLLLSFFGGYFSSFKKMLRQKEICKKKNPEIRKNPEKSQTW